MGSKRLQGRVAFITGAARGQGRAEAWAQRSTPMMSAPSSANRNSNETRYITSVSLPVDAGSTQR